MNIKNRVQEAMESQECKDACNSGTYAEFIAELKAELNEEVSNYIDDFSKIYDIKAK